MKRTQLLASHRAAPWLRRDRAEGKKPETASELQAVREKQKQKLLALIGQHPGLDAIALKGKGWRPQTHGQLRDAERAGWVIYLNGGWYIKFDHEEKEVMP